MMEIYTYIFPLVTTRYSVCAYIFKVNEYGVFVVVVIGCCWLSTCWLVEGKWNDLLVTCVVHIAKQNTWWEQNHGKIATTSFCRHQVVRKNARPCLMFNNSNNNVKNVGFCEREVSLLTISLHYCNVTVGVHVVFIKHELTKRKMWLVCQ